MAERSTKDPAGLVAAMAAGDSGPALTAFCEEYSSTMLGLLTRMLGSRAEAEEILQEVLVELWRRASDYDAARGSVRAWLLTITRSRALDALRARSRRPRGQQIAIDDKRSLESPGSAPDVLVSSTRWYRALTQAVQSLNEEQREVLERSYFYGMSHGQIADDLNLPVGTVKSRILAGVRALRTTLPIVHRAMRV